MKAAFAAATVLLLAAPAFAAPGDPRTLRGNLEWPVTLSAEPFAVIRGDDGRVYYADVSGARRMNAGAIAGRISLVGVEGNQAHEIAAVVVGSGDSALAFAAPAVPAPADTPMAPSSLPQQVATPAPPPAAVPSAPPAAPPTANTPPTDEPDDLWQVQGKVAAVTTREFLIETRPGENVLIDVSRLSSWTRETVRPGDQVKLFGVPQKDRRLMANGFIQEVTPGRAASR
jgi:hypothetical protein